MAGRSVRGCIKILNELWLFSWDPKQSLVYYCQLQLPPFPFRSHRAKFQLPIKNVTIGT
jgi:hypothetical protein